MISVVRSKIVFIIITVVVVVVVIIDVVVFVVIVILVTTSMQGIYNYIPETNRVSRVCSAAAVLYLQFMLHIMLFCP